MLAELVAKGELPPVDDRLPENPCVCPVFEMVGRYGGTFRRLHKGLADRRGLQKLMTMQGVQWEMEPYGTPVMVPLFWESLEVSEDAKTYTIHLRKGARWSDGELIDTEDIRFWFEDVYQNESIDAGAYGTFAPEGKLPVLEIIDSLTCSFTYHVPQPIMPLTSINYTAMRGSPTFSHPEHYMKQFLPQYATPEELDAAVKKYGTETWDQMWGQYAEGPAVFWWTNPAVPMAGAWRSTTAQPADHIVMERNPYYWMVDPEGNQLPYIDYVHTDNFDNPEVFDMRLINGEIDAQVRHMNMSSYTLYMENQEQGGYVIETWILPVTTGFNFNIALQDPVLAPVLNDINMRHALSIAINREEMNELLYLGLQTPRQACPSKYSPEYDPEYESKWIEYDPDGANAILDEAGYTQRDAQGFRMTPDGQPIAIPIEWTTITGSPFGPEVELVIKYWEAVGIKAINKEMERSLWEERLNNNDIAIPIYTCDKSFILMTNPERYYGDMWATAYKDWYRSSGKSGLEPPADHPIRDIWAAWDAVQQEPDEAKRHEMFMDGVITPCKENIWALGTVGDGPALVVRNKKLRNLVSGLVEENSTASIYIARPEQFFFEE